MTIRKVPSYQTRWSNALVEAVETKDRLSLEALVEQYRQNPAVAGYFEAPNTPLRKAIWAMSPWAFHFLLDQYPVSSVGELGLPEVGEFFKSLAACDAEHRSFGQEFIEGIWPRLQPMVGTTPTDRLAVLLALLQQFPQPDVARTYWHALGMPAWCEGIVDQEMEPRGESYKVTPLQLAWLKGCPVAVELLLEAGASMEKANADSGLFWWDLVEVLECQEYGLEDLPGDAPFERDRWHARLKVISQWPCQSLKPALTEQAGQAFVSMCTSHAAWQGVKNHVRARQLEDALPVPQASLMAPRF